MNEKTAEKRSIADEVVREYERILKDKPGEPRETIQRTEQEMRKGFPPATSAEARQTRVTY